MYSPFFKYFFHIENQKNIILRGPSMFRFSIEETFNIFSHSILKNTKVSDYSNSTIKYQKMNH